MDALNQYVLPGLAAVAAIAALVLGSNGPEGYALIAWIAAAVFACGSVISHSTRLGVFFTALGCMTANAYLLSRKWEAVVAAAGPSICNISDTINCDAVNASPYSMAFGIPITLLGVAFYLGLAGASLFGSKSTPRFHQVNGLFALTALAYSVFLFFVTVSMGKACVLCYSIYAGNILLFVAALKGLRETGGSLTDGLGDVPNSRSFLTVSGIFAVTVLSGAVAWKQHAPPVEAEVALGARPAPPVEGIAKLYALPNGEVTVDGSEPIHGDPSAPYVVVEWADYGCPHCAKAAMELHELVELRPDVQVRFKPFPLSGACNPIIEGDRGAERCLAAVATECAGQQGKFWELNNLIFKNLGYLSKSDLAFMADQAGLDVAAWETCLVDPASAEAVGRDIEAGIRAGVKGTPAIFLKGTHGDQFVLIQYSVPELLAVIEAHSDGKVLPPPGPQALR